MIADEMLGLSDTPSDSGRPTPQSGLKFLPQRLPLFSWAGLILALALIHGDAVYQLTLRRCRLFRTEQVVIRLGIGLGILSTVTLSCGLAGTLNRTSICIPSFISLAVSGFIRWKSGRVETCQGLPPIPVRPSSRVIVSFATLVIAPFIVYLLLGTVSPPSDFDVREYHLQGPKEWFQQGQITILTHNVYTSFPFLSEMLSLTGMVFAADWWHGALVGKIVLSCFQLLSTLTVFSIARRWISKDVAWLASLIYLTTPWTLRISLIAYAEGALTFYLIAATMTALLVRQFPGRRIGMTIVCGMFAGSAMATKYTGLISVILPTAAVIALQFRKSGNESEDDASPKQVVTYHWRSLRFPAAAFSLGVALMIAPWLLKNLVETGNPVYPLAYKIFGGSEWSPEMEARWQPAHAASEHNLLNIPNHILDVAVGNKWTSGLLFAFAVPSVVLWRRNATVLVILCLLAWGFGTWWAFTHRIDRFWIPLIPLLSLAAGATWLISVSNTWKALLVMVIASVTHFNVCFCGSALIGFHVGLMDLDTARQMTIRADIRYLNETLPSHAKVLMVGEAQVFDATFPLAYNTVFDDCLFERWTTLPEDSQLPVTERRMLPSKKIQAALKDRGITHVVVNWGEILRYRMPASYGFTHYVQPSRFEELIKQNVLTRTGTLLTRHWQDLSDTERRMVVSWNGYQQLVADDSTFSVVELYSVPIP